MKHSWSPLNGNTIWKLAESEYLTDDFLSKVPNVESSHEFHNTDSDPDYGPSLGIDTDQPLAQKVILVTPVHSKKTLLRNKFVDIMWC